MLRTSKSVIWSVWVASDFCAEHSIVADIELVRADQINESYERMLKGDVKYRFVIDNSTLVD
ncbi:hypothetical protein [Pseudomonas fluorescens]|uniref:hypothetical protein n=1 Tax=Pseudomonas fluorescens TaxID=294 RepID=UPI001CD3ACF5|nr:hypothetical protein [Pseudomonas fluorescens]